MEKLENISTLQGQESFHLDLIHKKERQKPVGKQWVGWRIIPSEMKRVLLLLGDISPATSAVNPSLNSDVLLTLTLRTVYPSVLPELESSRVTILTRFLVFSFTVSNHLLLTLKTFFFSENTKKGVEKTDNSSRETSIQMRWMNLAVPLGQKHTHESLAHSQIDAHGSSKINRARVFAWQPLYSDSQLLF